MTCPPRAAPAAKGKAVKAERCWSCARPMRHTDDNLCRGCKHHVCVKCCLAYGHWNNEPHGKKPVTPARRAGKGGAKR